MESEGQQGLPESQDCRACLDPPDPPDRQDLPDPPDRQAQPDRWGLEGLAVVRAQPDSQVHAGLVVRPGQWGLLAKRVLLDLWVLPDRRDCLGRGDPWGIVDQWASGVTVVKKDQ